MDAKNASLAPAAIAVAALAAAGAVGSLLMALAHWGIELPLVSALAPGVGVVPPAAIAFAVTAAAYVAVLVGILGRRRWAWPAALAVNGVTLVGAAMPYRGPVSAAAIIVTIAAIALLLSPPGRAALR